MIRAKTSGWDSEMRQETTVIRTMTARRDDTCPFENCGRRRIIAGRTEITKRNGQWGHYQCPPVAVQRVDDTDAVDIALAEFDARTARSEPLRASQATVPSGRYTVRGADEVTASVLSFETPSFGSFPEGARAVSVHGSFAVKGRSGLSEHRSWLGFAIVFPGGRISVYSTARAMMDNGAPEADKLRRAVKHLRLMIEAGEAELMQYGRAYAQAENQCFICARPLLDETSQSLGIGPVCRKRFSQEMASGAAIVY